MENRLHAPEEFLGKFGSKLDLYQLMTVDCEYSILIIFSGILLASIQKNIIRIFTTNSCRKEKGDG